jgi:hypothetical protein
LLHRNLYKNIVSKQCKFDKNKKTKSTTSHPKIEKDLGKDIIANTRARYL